MSWWLLFAGLMMLVFWVGIMLVWVSQELIARRTGPAEGAQSALPGPTSLDIANEHSARDDISQEELEHIERPLEQS